MTMYTPGANFLLGLVICIAAGCDPLIVNVEQEGKSVPRSVYEYGLAWPFPRDVEQAPSPDVLRRELLALAPLGTSRTGALHRLTAAGIKIDRSVQPASAGREQPDPDRFVGSFWNRPQGKVWIVSFGFEFDESHKLSRIDVDPAPESETSKRINTIDSTTARQPNWGTAPAGIPWDARPGYAPSLSR
jgi:hypothetical protein